ncbi:MAG: DUF2961 domain-containing protein, partial [Chitinophagaceae bacterium]
MNKLISITTAIIICSLLVAHVNAQDSVTLKSLLTEMTDPSSVAVVPANRYTMHQASSYDRRSVSADQPGWFANGDFNQYIRTEQTNGRTEHVMMEADGPGAIVRFWLTTVVKPGTIRFYLDNSTTPAIESSAFDMMKAGLALGPALLNPHSSYEPEGKGGNTLYFPVSYAKHCRITVEFPDTVIAKKSHYYQVNYRTYAKGTKVATFTMNDLLVTRARIDAAEKTLWKAPLYANGKKISNDLHLPPSARQLIPLPAGPTAIRDLQFSISLAKGADTGVALRNLLLKIEFDGMETVMCPVGDFSGSGYGGRPVASWYRSLDSNLLLTSRWVMPYKQTARVTLINQSPDAVNVKFTATLSPWTWTASSMYFHATYQTAENIWDAKWDWNPSKPTRGDTLAPIEWNFVTIEGGGIYLGNTLAVDNLMDTWYGEGDAKIWVDDDRFPSEFGTGLEDYYNTSWAPVVLYQTPFANAPRADNASSFGHNTFTRTRNLDGVPFRKSFRYDLEMLSWDGGRINA